jgi:hypothetical protein
VAELLASTRPFANDGSVKCGPKIHRMSNCQLADESVV